MSEFPEFRAFIILEGWKLRRPSLWGTSGRVGPWRKKPSSLQGYVQINPHSSKVHITVILFPKPLNPKP